MNMKKYIGDGDVVKMVAIDGEKINPNGCEWVKASDADIAVKDAATKSVMGFVNSMIGAFESGFVDDNKLTLAELYRVAQHHLRDNYGSEIPNMRDAWGDETYKSCSQAGCCADCKKRILDNETRNFMCSLTNANTVASAICPHYDRDPDVPF